MPEIQRAYDQLAPQGLVLMAISIDEPLDVAVAFAAVNGATFPIFSVPDRGLIADRYDLYNVPTHLFIDADGVVRKIIAGPVNEESALAAAATIMPTSAGAGSAG
jgi:hypothetical protein